MPSPPPAAPRRISRPAAKAPPVGCSGCAAAKSCSPKPSTGAPHSQPLTPPTKSPRRSGKATKPSLPGRTWSLFPTTGRPSPLCATRGPWLPKSGREQPANGRSAPTTTTRSSRSGGAAKSCTGPATTRPSRAGCFTRKTTRRRRNIPWWSRCVEAPHQPRDPPGPPDTSICPCSPARAISCSSRIRAAATARANLSLRAT